MKTLAQPRWLLSFADLSLLLLAFFVMLHARQSEADRIVRGIGAALAPDSAAAGIRDFDADGLFEPREAVLRAAARLELGALGESWAHGGRVVVTSQGHSSPGFRFDAWELSAARTAAVARALSRAGIPAAAIDIEMWAAPAAARGKGQRLILRHLPA